MKNLQKGMGENPGQITVLNLIMVLITLFLYFAFVPVIEPMIHDTIDYLENNSSNPYTSIISVMLYMLPFMLLLVIVVTAFNYAVPRREGT